MEIDQLVYTSGQLGIDPATGELADGVEAQAKQALENVKAILAEAGLEMSSIIKTLVFIKDMNDFGKVNAIYAQYINGDVLPARSCVEVAALPKGGLVEIEVIAKK
ncbi:MAG: Rid family detoxifying hydrolase [Clostridiaceae bacterium]|nr:Rid family detoxifying hydrolase [Clostridiaceae bacterium]